MAGTLLAQDTLHGKVVSICKGHVAPISLANVEISVDSTSRGMAADMNGQFRFDGLSGSIQLSAQFTGFSRFQCVVELEKLSKPVLIVLEHHADCDFDNELQKIKPPRFKDYHVLKNTR